MKLKLTLIATTVFAGMAVFQIADCSAQTFFPRLSSGNYYVQSSPTFRSVPMAGQGAHYPYVIARGPDREVIHTTPIEFRPNRPLHFYGNTVRRNYYGNSLLPFASRY